MSKPMTPPDCDLRDFPRMMIDIGRLFASEFDATSDDSAWRCGVTLWLKSFHQVPAASLPDDDAQLARLAGLGRDVRTWMRRRAHALRGWIKCDDGLLYHPVVAEIALEAWLEKLTQRISSGAGNAARWGVEFDRDPIMAEIGVSAALLADINPRSRLLSKQLVSVALKRSQRQSHSGVPPGSKDVPPGPINVPPGSQGKGREGNSSEEEESSSASKPAFDASDDPDKAAWTTAVSVLGKTGGETEARKFFGRLLAQHKLQAKDLLPSLANVIANGTQDPKSYLTKAAAGVARRRAGPEPERRVGWC